MVALLAFWQCGLAFLMLSLRYSAGFGKLKRILMWCVTFGRLGRRKAGSEDLSNDADGSPKSKNGDAKYRATWYWFHLIAQVGFFVREVKVIMMIEGWYWEVVLANLALLLGFFCTSFHVWQFSYLRSLKGVHHGSVDQVLDMLMLPLNFGFLAAATVRTLRTQHGHPELMEATLESASVWQAWALWSLLKLFSRVVELATQDGSAKQEHGSTTKHETGKPGMARKDVGEDQSPSRSGGPQHSSTEHDSEGHVQLHLPSYSKQRSMDPRNTSCSTSPAQSLASPALKRQVKSDQQKTSRAASPQSALRSGEQFLPHGSNFVRPMDVVSPNPQSSEMDLSCLEQDAKAKAPKLTLAGPMGSVGGGPTVVSEGFETPSAEGFEPGPYWTHLASDELDSMKSRMLQIATKAETVDALLPPSGNFHPKADWPPRMTNVYNRDGGEEPMSDAVPRVLGGRNVTVVTAQCEDTARLIARAYVQRLTTMQAVSVETTWRCTRRSGASIRLHPELDGSQGGVLGYLEIFRVSEQLEKNVGGVKSTFLKLVDGRGWVLDRDSKHKVCELVEVERLHREVQEGRDANRPEGPTSWEVNTDNAEGLRFLCEKADVHDVPDVYNFPSPPRRGRSRNSSDVDANSQATMIGPGCGPLPHAGPSRLVSMDRESDRNAFRRGSAIKRLHESQSAGSLHEVEIKKEKKEKEGEANRASKEGTAKEKYSGLVRNFGMVSETGVCSWVFGQLIINIIDLSIKGVVAQLFPTWCNYLLGTCMGCSQYYDTEYWPMIKGSMCLLSLTAVSFVLLSEGVWSKEYLSKIQGRRSIKSKSIQITIGVSYAQWFLLRYMLDLPRSEAYMWHGLLCCIEMGLLALWHFQIAYSFDDDKWMQVVLPEDAGHWPDLTKLDRTLTGQGPRCDMLTFFLVSVFACYISGLLVCWLIPPDADVLPAYPIDNMTCTESVSAAITQHGNPWHIALGMEEMTWLPLCNSMGLKCRPGYIGKPRTYCSYDRALSILGTCTIVGCGPPSPHIHAVARIDPNQKDAVWTSGMHVLYNCELGYQGSPVAVCESDGTWNFVGTKCTIIGCGALQYFLEKHYEKKWRHVMVPALDNATEFKSSYDGQVVSFNCHKGLAGKPVATCISGVWRLSDPCTPFNTAKKCSCRQRWIHCGGWLFKGGRLSNVCHRWFGCAIGTGSPYAWCQVSVGSCPASSHDFFGREPLWDYCVPSEFNNTWPPEAAPSQGCIHFFGFIVLKICSCAAAALFAWCCFLGSKEALSRCMAGRPNLLHLCEAIRRIPGAFRRHWRTMSYITKVRLKNLMSSVRAKAESSMSKIGATAESIKSSVRSRLEEIKPRIHTAASEIMSKIGLVGSHARDTAEDISSIVRAQTENIRSRTEDFGRRTSCSVRIFLGNASVSAQSLVEQGRDGCATVFKSIPMLPNVRRSLTRSQADCFSDSLVAPLMKSSSDTRSNSPGGQDVSRSSVQDWGRTLVASVSPFSSNRRTFEDTALSSNLPHMDATIRRLTPNPDEVPACNLVWGRKMTDAYRSRYTVTKMRPPPPPRAKPTEPPRTLVAAAVTLQPPPVRADADQLLATQPKIQNPRSTLFWR